MNAIKNIILTVFIIISGSFFSYAENGMSKKTEAEIEVLGNCGMCKERIEQAAYGVKGVRFAEWDKDEKVLTLVFRNDKTDQETVERAIAKAGHDTENFITDEKTHQNLHHCCIYPRNPEWVKNNKQYDEE